MSGSSNLDSFRDGRQVVGLLILREYNLPKNISKNYSLVLKRKLQNCVLEMYFLIILHSIRCTKMDLDLA